MTPAQHIAEQFQCSELAAGEICHAAKALAQEFVTVHDAYDLAHVLDAKRAVRKVTYYYEPRKTARPGGVTRNDMQRAERLRLNRKALSRGATNLFNHAQRAVQAMGRFQTAINIANCQNYVGMDEALSETLSALHDARQLSSPDKVGDGRLAYESMRRDYLLLQELGILKS